MKISSNAFKKSESQTLEFKLSLSLDEIGEVISAFSNTRGGKILVGVEDKGKITGLEIGKKTLEDLANFIKRNTDPPVFPSIKVEEIESKEIIVIKIEESKEKPVFFKNRAYKRVGKATHRISASEIRKLVLESKKVYWDEQVCEEASLDDVDKEKIKWFLDKRFSARKMLSPAQMNISDILRSIGCVRIVNGKIMLTNSAVLFFGKNPQIFIPFRILCVRFKGDEVSRTTIDSLDCSGTLWEMLEQAEEFVRKNVRLFGFRTSLSFRRIDKLEYPAEAVREIILNALIHRDYSIPSDIKIFVFDSRIEIINPGSFPDGVTPQNPLHIARNPVLCQLMRDIGYIEKYGTGIYFVRSLCKEWGIPEPEFEIKQLETKVVFRSTGEGILVSEMKKQGIELNERQRRGLEIIFSKGRITNSEYARQFKVSRNSATNDLTDLIRKGLVKRIGKGRGCYYIPKI